MKTSYRIAFSLYLLMALFAAGGGLVYLLVPTIMPYHQQAIGVPWDGLGEGVRALLWLFVKLIGGLGIILSVITFVLTLIPFRNHERWAVLTLPLVAFLTNAMMLGATIYVKYKTGAVTPIAMMAVSTGVVVVAFLLSMGGRGSE